MEHLNTSYLLTILLAFVGFAGLLTLGSVLVRGFRSGWGFLCHLAATLFLFAGILCVVVLVEEYNAFQQVPKSDQSHSAERDNPDVNETPMPKVPQNELSDNTVNGPKEGAAPSEE